MWIHLVWIIPTVFTAGLVTAVFCMEAKLADEEMMEEWAEEKQQN